MASPTTSLLALVVPVALVLTAVEAQEHTPHRVRLALVHRRRCTLLVALVAIHQARHSSVLQAHSMVPLRQSFHQSVQATVQPHLCTRQLRPAMIRLPLQATRQRPQATHRHHHNTKVRLHHRTTHLHHLRSVPHHQPRRFHLRTARPHHSIVPPVQIMAEVAATPGNHRPRLTIHRPRHCTARIAQPLPRVHNTRPPVQYTMLRLEALVRHLLNTLRIVQTILLILLSRPRRINVYHICTQ